MGRERFEIAYTTKDGRREFEDARTRKSGESKLSKLIKSGKLDTNEDYCVMEFDNKDHDNLIG